MNDRRTRRFKERRPMFPFGQLMLPVIGVVAIGLLVIGVKLFFFPGTDNPVIAFQEDSSENSITQQSPSSPEPVKQAKKAVPVAQPVASPAEKAAQPKSDRVEQILAVPVTGKGKDAPRIEPSSPPTTAKTAPDKKKTASPSSQTEQESSPAPASKKPSRDTWAVQIGAFSAKASADSVLAKVRAQGFQGEINQAQVNGKTFYRVRVPSENSRESAVSLAKKLQTKGYPTLVVPYNR